MRTLIRDRTQSVAIAMPDSSYFEWPQMIDTFTSLKRLQVGSSEERLKPFLPRFNIRTLPSTLSSLKLYVANGFTQALEIPSDLDFQDTHDPKPVDLQSLYPNLTEIALSNGYTKTKTNILSSNFFISVSRLPLVLLDVSPFNVSLKDFAYLPPTLTSLKITPSAYVEREKLPDDFSLPKSLKTLKLSQLALCNIYEFLPKELLHLELEFPLKHKGIAAPDAFSHLSPNLISFSLLDKNYDMREMQYKLLPRSLLRLTLKVKYVEAEALCFLPRGMIHYKSSCEYPYADYALVRDLPPHLRTFETFVNLPPTVWRDLPASVEIFTPERIYQQLDDAFQPGILPNVREMSYLTPTPVQIRSGPCQTLQKLQLEGYGSSPASYSDEYLVTPEIVDIFNKKMPNLRELLMWVRFDVSLLANLEIPLESIDIANPINIGYLFLDKKAAHAKLIASGQTPPPDIPKDAKNDKGKKEKKEKEKEKDKKRHKASEKEDNQTVLWARNLKRLTLWSHGAFTFVEPKEAICWMKLIPSSLTELRFIHKWDPFCFPSPVQIFHHLPPQLTLFAAAVAKFPPADVLAKLPRRLRTLELSGRGTEPCPISLQQLQALPHSVTSLTLPHTATLPKEGIQEWFRDRPHLVEMKRFENVNTNVAAIVTEFWDYAPAVSLRAALLPESTERKRRTRPISEATSSAAPSSSASSSSASSSKLDKKKEKESKDKEKEKKKKKEKEKEKSKSKSK